RSTARLGVGPGGAWPWSFRPQQSRLPLSTTQPCSEPSASGSSTLVSAPGTAEFALLYWPQHTSAGPAGRASITQLLLPLTADTSRTGFVSPVGTPDT